MRVPDIVCRADRQQLPRHRAQHDERRHGSPALHDAGRRGGPRLSGAMLAETNHFIEAVALDRPVIVTPEQARQVMEVTLAADLSTERNQPVRLPLDTLG